MNALKFKCICFLQEHENEWFLLQIFYPHFSGKEAATFMSHDHLLLLIVIRLCAITTASYGYVFFKKNYSGSDRFFPRPIHSLASITPIAST
jgi:hypothetical protein